jgi:hypothetical protein
LDVFWLRFVIRISGSEFLGFFIEIVWVGIIFGGKMGVLQVKGFGLVVELGVGFGGHEAKGWVPLLINLGHAVLSRPKRRHHTWVDITTGYVVIDNLGRGKVGIVIVKTGDTLVS